MNATCFFFQNETDNIDQVAEIRGWKKMIVSFLFMSPYWRNIPPIGEWLCYVNTFYLLTNKEELDVDELDKNLVELKEHCEMYAPPKTAFFELLYEKFKEHRNHPNLKELMLKLIRTRDEETLLQKEALCLDYFSKVKFDGVHSETEQVEAHNPETSTGGTDSSETTTGGIDSPETTTCDTDSPETTTGDIDAKNDVNKEKETENNPVKSLRKETTDHSLIKSGLYDKSCTQVKKSDLRESISTKSGGGITSGLLDAGNASHFHRNKKNAAETEQIPDLKDGKKNEQSDENPDSENAENAKVQNTVNDAQNDNTLDASLSWITVAKDDTVEIHEDQTTDKTVGGGEEVTEVEKGNADKFQDDSEDEDGFVRVEYKDLE